MSYTNDLCYCGDPKCLYSQGKQQVCSTQMQKDLACKSCADLKRRVEDLEGELKIHDINISGMTVSKDGKRVPLKEIFKSARELELESLCRSLAEALEIISDHHKWEYKLNLDCKRGEAFLDQPTNIGAVHDNIVYQFRCLRDRAKTALELFRERMK